MQSLHVKSDKIFSKDLEFKESLLLDLRRGVILCLSSWPKLKMFLKKLKSQKLIAKIGL